MVYSLYILPRTNSQKGHNVSKQQFPLVNEFFVNSLDIHTVKLVGDPVKKFSLTTPLNGNTLKLDCPVSRFSAHGLTYADRTKLGFKDSMTPKQVAQALVKLGVVDLNDGSFNAAVMNSFIKGDADSAARRKQEKKLQQDLELACRRVFGNNFGVIPPGARHSGNNYCAVGWDKLKGTYWGDQSRKVLMATVSFDTDVAISGPGRFIIRFALLPDAFTPNGFKINLRGVYFSGDGHPDLGDTSCHEEELEAFKGKSAKELRQEILREFFSSGGYTANYASSVGEDEQSFSGTLFFKV